MAVEGRADEAEAGLATVTRGTALVIAGALSLVVFTFGSRVILVRSPDSDWNAFSLQLTLTSILATIGSLGLQNAVARALPYAESDLERGTIVRFSLTLTLLSAGLLGAGIWVASPLLAHVFGNPGLTLGLRFFAIAVAASLVAGIMASIFRGFSDVVPYALLTQALTPGLFVLFLVAVLLLPGVGVSYTVALWAYALSNALVLALVVAYSLRRLPIRISRNPTNSGVGGKLLRFTGPLFVSAVCLTVAGTGDTIVLGLYHPMDVGFYTASLTLARLVPVGVSSASYILLPVSTSLIRRGKQMAVRLTYVTITKWLMVLSLPLLVVFVFMPASSLRFVYGSQDVSATLPLRLATTGAFLSTILGPAFVMLIAYGRVKLVAINSVVAAVADLGIALVLVPHYGLVGAAVAWGASNFILAGLCLFNLARLEGVHPFHRHYVVPLTFTVLLLSPLALLGGSRVLVSLLPFVCIFVAGLFATVVIVSRSIDEGDRVMLSAIESIVGRPIPLVRGLAARLSRRPPGLEGD